MLTAASFILLALMFGPSPATFENVHGFYRDWNAAATEESPSIQTSLGDEYYINPSLLMQFSYH